MLIEPVPQLSGAVGEFSVSTRLLVGQTGGHSHDLCQSDGFVWGKVSEEVPLSRPAC